MNDFSPSRSTTSGRTPDRPRATNLVSCTRSPARRTSVASANQLDDAGNRIYRPATRTQCEPLRPARSRPPASDAVSGHGVRRIARDGSLLQPCFAVLSNACLRAQGAVDDREGRWSKQSKAARERQWTKRRAGHLREDHAWSERHGITQQMSATRFAAPSFLFAEPALPVIHVRAGTWREVAGLKVGTTSRCYIRRTGSGGISVTSSGHFFARGAIRLSCSPSRRLTSDHASSWS